MVEEDLVVVVVVVVELLVELLELLKNEVAYDDIVYDDTPLVVQLGPNDG